MWNDDYSTITDAKITEVIEQIHTKKDMVVLSCLADYLGREPELEDVYERCSVTIYPDKEVFLFDGVEYLEIYQSQSRFSDDGMTLYFDFNWRRING